MAEERAGVKAVHSTAAEHEPAAVPAPGMVAVNVLRVRGFKGEALSGGKIRGPQVCVLVPDGEVAIFLKSEDKEPAVGGYSWEGDAFPVLEAVVEGVHLLAERSVLGVEVNAEEAVFDF